jgi:hypothetical protein
LPPNGWSNFTSKRALNLKIGAKRATCSARPVAWSADPRAQCWEAFWSDDRVCTIKPAAARIASGAPLCSIHSAALLELCNQRAADRLSHCRGGAPFHFKLKNSVKSPIEGDWDRMRAPALR